MAGNEFEQKFQAAIKEADLGKAEKISSGLRSLQESVNAMLIGTPERANIEEEVYSLKGHIIDEMNLDDRRMMMDDFLDRLDKWKENSSDGDAAVLPQGHEVVSEAPTYERTRNYKSGHSTVRGVKPGFEDMPVPKAVKSRTLTGQVDIDGFGMKWRKASWYKRFIDAAAALKFCAPLMDDETKAWIAEVQPAIDVFARLKDVLKNKWKNEIWKFIAADRKINAPMIYAPGGALNFLLAFDRLLDVQPEVKTYALAGNATDLNKLNIAWIRMERGAGKKRAEKAKERRATVRTYAEVVGSVPAPVVLPGNGEPAPITNPVLPVAPKPNPAQPPAPVPTPPNPPAPALKPPEPAAPGPDVHTHKPEMDTSPDKLNFGPNKAFLDQYMINDEYPEFVKGLKIFDDTDFKNFSLNPLVIVDPSKDDINESELKTPELDKWLDDLSKSDQEYWKPFGVDWSNPDDRQRGAGLPLLQKCFDNGNPKKKILRLFDRLSTFKENFRFYFFDSKRPVALKLQKLYFWAGLRIFQYGKYMNPTFHNAADANNGGHYYTRLLLDGNWKTPLPADMSKWVNVPNDFWEHADDAIKFRVLSLFRSMARQLDLTAANPATKAEAQKWLEDNRASLDANKTPLDSLEP